MQKFTGAICLGEAWVPCYRNLMNGAFRTYIVSLAKGKFIPVTENRYSLSNFPNQKSGFSQVDMTWIDRCAFNLVPKPVLFIEIENSTTCNNHNREMLIDLSEKYKCNSVQFSIVDMPIVDEKSKYDNELFGIFSEMFISSYNNSNNSSIGMFMNMYSLLTFKPVKIRLMHKIDKYSDVMVNPPEMPFHEWLSYVCPVDFVAVRYMNMDVRKKFRKFIGISKELYDKYGETKCD